MGKKKSSSATAIAATKENAVKKLSQQKRNELNQFADHLLKICFDSTANLTEQWNQYNEIQIILQRIQAIECELKTKTGCTKNRASAIDQFYKWALNNGAKFDDVKINQFPNYEFGLEATKDFQQNELFVTVPKKMIMSLDNLSETAAQILSQLPVLDTMPNVKLAFFLVVERLNVHSFWKPYIDLLPEKYPTIMNYTISEMNELKGTSAFVPALNQCKHIARQYAFIRKALHSLKMDKLDTILNVLKERFTYDLYCWAVSTVMTRQNAIPIEQNESETKETDVTVAESSETPALIPFWDLANHTEGIVTTSYNVAARQIEGAILFDIKKSEQIFIHYGNRNNANLLVHNGFVTNNNLSDSVSICLGLSPSDPLVIQRTKLLESLGISKKNEIRVLPAPKYISPELLGFVRIFNMNEEQLNHWLAPDKSATDLLYLDCAFDTALEIKTWTFLKMRLTLLLKAFATTLEEDQCLLETHQKNGQLKLGHIKAMIIQYRIMEKRILHDALGYIEERIKP